MRGTRSDEEMSRSNSAKQGGIRLQRCITGSVVIAVVGLLLSCGTWTFGPRDIRTSPVQMTPGEASDAAGKGDVPLQSSGPRAPANDLERRQSVIPEYHPEKDLVFFSHIHKTSGTSLSVLLANIFPRTAVVPTSHPSKAVDVQQLRGHDEAWWEPYQVMFSHNRPNITDTIGVPASKTPRLLLVVRNPLLHKASIFFESVCRYGLHIKNGTIDQEEATLARIKTSNEGFRFCRDAELWVGSEQFCTVYRNFEASWLSYGAADRHPCQTPRLDVNTWRTGRDDEDGTCGALKAQGGDAAVWEDFFERAADAAIRRLEGALWVGVTERMEESACLLFLTLGKKEREVPQHRFKTPRPISVWHQQAKDKAAEHDRADWRVFKAANDILDLRLWEARKRLKDAGEEERESLGEHCFDLLAGRGAGGGGGSGGDVR
ncbi:unnamed protein product [Pylaiella littoralis]